MINHTLKFLLLGILLVGNYSFAETINFKGLEYKVVVSPYTKNKWLDRNLGALKNCVNIKDQQCFGHYYQWGRKADGHEKAYSKVVKKSKLHTIQSNKFISIKSNDNFDWNKNPNDNLWTGFSSNNVCPTGFRIPTIDELTAEVKRKKSFLNIPLSGYKSFCNGNLVQQKKQGALWSSSVYEQDAFYLDVRPHNIELSTSSRGDAFPVRCIKQ